MGESVAGSFDAVISCDNALPHVLERLDLLSAARSIRSRLRPGGLLLASIRDYDRVLGGRRGDTEGTVPVVFDPPPGRRIYFQVWDWEKDDRTYAANLFLVSESGGSWETRHHRTRYRAVLRAELEDVLAEAGFKEIEWRMPEASGYYQPLVIARNQV